MEWFSFIIGATFWAFLFYLVRENPRSAARIGLFSFINIIFGVMMLSGINYPTGSTIVTTGSTMVQTIVYTTYTAELSGANSFPLLYGFAWGTIVLGIVLLFYTIIAAYNQIFSPKASTESV